MYRHLCRRITRISFGVGGFGVIGKDSVLFLDGIGCNPTGFKPRFITGLGYCVTTPMLPDLDFPAAVAAADRAAQEAQAG